eukprot:SAG25_NODE_896_length_4875_cov_4.075586_4_plen_82_part_00
MGSPKCRIVGKSQPGLIMIDPMISTRTRRPVRALMRPWALCGRAHSRWFGGHGGRVFSHHHATAVAFLGVTFITDKNRISD